MARGIGIRILQSSPIPSAIVPDRASHEHRFIGLRRHPVQDRLQITPCVLDVVGRGVRREPQWPPPDEQPAAERIREEKAVPTAEDFFFEHANVSGTIGRPVALAKWTTPGWAIWRGPFGPSGVTAISPPLRPPAMSRRRAAVPPRVVEPLTEWNPNRDTTRWISSPS